MIKRHRMTFAVGILAAWVAGLGALAWREVGRGDAERLAEVALRVTPAATRLAARAAPGATAALRSSPSRPSSRSWSRISPSSRPRRSRAR